MEEAALDLSGWNSEDVLFGKPYFDIDEWREAPVRHRYVHGGFEGTDTRFSYYFPPADQYEGRFFQHVTPVPGSENAAQEAPVDENNKIGSSIDGGAYFVETNGGGRIDLTKGSNALADPTITAYRANAASAQFSRLVAGQVYGTNKRPFGYIYGGSGGAYRTIGSVENTQGVWDGAVPYVPGSLMAIPNMFTVRMQALRVLRDKFPGIIDAVEPGGSGDPYAHLNEYEASVLKEIELMGFPMESWFGYRMMGLHGFAALYGGVAMADPTYFTDFWTKPGYLGHDRPELFEEDRIQFSTTIAEPITALEAHRLGLSDDPFASAQPGNVDTAFKGTNEEAKRVVGFRLSDTPPPKYLLGGELVVSSGSATGERIALNTLQGDVVMLGVVNPQMVAQVAAGDAVMVDNSNFLAMETYHRHQVPGPDYPVWDQFRDGAGKPIYPQRPMIIGPIFVQSTSGSKMNGKVDEKMIIAASLWDREAMPWQADWYRRRVEAYHGAEATDNVRLYYTNHALHGDALPEQMAESPARIVNYVPVLQQALRDVAAWVEKGVVPPSSTQYEIVEGQVVTPENAAQRKGIQPTVQLSVDGGERVEVGVGEPVTFTGVVTVPPGTGAIVSVRWDFEGSGSFATGSPVPDKVQEITVSATHSYDTPGIYFPALEGVSQREGDKETPYARIAELGRVRVVVK
ncbi:MAG: hypothetical protein H6917_00510 [Novosphingobium sp.]|nr:hypothetical protein [Novosphingobium sp.]